MVYLLWKFAVKIVSIWGPVLVVAGTLILIFMRNELEYQHKRYLKAEAKARLREERRQEREENNDDDN